MTELTSQEEATWAAIDEACAMTQEQYFDTGKTCDLAKELTLRRAESSDLPLIQNYLSETIGSEKDYCRLDVPNFYVLILRRKDSTDSDGSLVGLVSFYLAYSTWDGRVLYLDKMLLFAGPVHPGMLEQRCHDSQSLRWSLDYTLADIGLRLNCARYTWQHHTPFPKYPGEAQPETLQGWLTLHRLQHRQQQKNGFKTSDNTIDSGSKVWTAESDKSSIKQSLEAFHQKQQQQQQQQQQSTSTLLRLRLATEDDLETIERLVMGLAEFEKEPESVHVTKEHYRRDGFSSDQPPLFHCLLLEHHKTSNNANNDNSVYYACGMAFVYYGFSLGRGRFLYLEDLYIEEKYRGMGGGSLVMQLLDDMALSTHCERQVWQALDWNTPALTFYNKIGANVVDGLLTTRFASDDLVKFHKERCDY